jgi:hypothetical protein
LKRETGNHNGDRNAPNNPLTRVMQIRQNLRNQLLQVAKNRNLKNRTEVSRLRRIQRKYNLLQKLKALSLTFKRRGKTGW